MHFDLRLIVSPDAFVCELDLDRSLGLCVEGVLR